MDAAGGLPATQSNAAVNHRVLVRSQRVLDYACERALQNISATKAMYGDGSMRSFWWQTCRRERRTGVFSITNPSNPCIVLTEKKKSTRSSLTRAACTARNGAQDGMLQFLTDRSGCCASRGCVGWPAARCCLLNTLSAASM
jgi:hypothetical protein